MGIGKIFACIFKYGTRYAVKSEKNVIKDFIRQSGSTTTDLFTLRKMSKARQVQQGNPIKDFIAQAGCTEISFKGGAHRRGGSI